MCGVVWGSLRTKDFNNHDWAYGGFVVSWISVWTCTSLGHFPLPSLGLPKTTPADKDWKVTKQLSAVKLQPCSKYFNINRHSSVSMSQAIAREKCQRQKNAWVGTEDHVPLCCSCGDVYQYMIFIIISRNDAGIIWIKVNWWNHKLSREIYKTVRKFLDSFACTVKMTNRDYLVWLWGKIISNPPSVQFRRTR